MDSRIASLTFERLSSHLTLGSNIWYPKVSNAFTKSKALVKNANDLGEPIISPRTPKSILSSRFPDDVRQSVLDSRHRSAIRSSIKNGTTVSS